VATGFRRDVPTSWLAEGLLPYLEPDAVGRLLHNVSALSAPGSQLAADVVSAQMMAARNAYATTLAQRSGALGNPIFRFGADEPVDIFARHGWRVSLIKHPGDADCDYGRWLGPPGAGVGFSFVFAERSI
jgi:methyltransferase (TIGR00027 family)